MNSDKQRGDQSKVAVTVPEIKGCLGVSPRDAYELIETMATDIPGVRMRESKRIETASGVTRKKKALLIDCERVSGETGGVNNFTTGGDE